MSTTVLAIAAAAALAIPAAVAAIAQGIASKSAMEAIARQPEKSGDIRSTLIIALALMEALAIYGLLVAFLIINKI